MLRVQVRAPPAAVDGSLALVESRQILVHVCMLEAEVFSTNSMDPRLEKRERNTLCGGALTCAHTCPLQGEL
jgi:coenzyme F420-reducing hydrogenase gamma subunit